MRRRVLWFSAATLLGVVALPILAADDHHTQVEPDVVTEATIDASWSAAVWSAPGQVVPTLSAAAGRPVTHVVTLEVTPGRLVADLVWPDASPDVERWSVGPDGAVGPSPAAALGPTRQPVVLSDLADAPFAAMTDHAVGTLAAGGGTVDRVVIGAGTDGEVEIEVHVTHAAGPAGSVVFGVDGVVRRVATAG